jgi:hypothetical protein
VEVAPSTGTIIGGGDGCGVSERMGMLVAGSVEVTEITLEEVAVDAKFSRKLELQPVLKRVNRMKADANRMDTVGFYRLSHQRSKLFE